MPTIEAAEWWARNRGEATESWIANYQQSVDGRQRTAIAAAVGGVQAQTVLEVGCHCGPNLIRLAREFPELEAVGIDASSQAVDAGQRWAKSQGFESRLKFHRGLIPQALLKLPSKAFDVVVSCYVLAYLSPQDVDVALYEMGRLAEKAVILAEPSVTGETTHKQVISGYQEWRHDYRDRKRWVQTLSAAKVGTIEIDPPVQALDEVLVFVV